MAGRRLRGPKVCVPWLLSRSTQGNSRGPGSCCLLSTRQMTGDPEIDDVTATRRLDEQKSTACLLVGALIGSKVRERSAYRLVRDCHPDCRISSDQTSGRFAYISSVP